MLIKYVCLVFALTCWNTYAQVVDSFSDGNFNLNPQWEGDTMNFVVNDASSLQLNAPSVAGVSTLYTLNNSIIEAEFNCTVQLDFNPSSQNYLRIFLQIDGTDFASDDAVYLQIGDSQDRITLQKRVDGISEIIAQSSNGVLSASSNIVECKVTRSEFGLWECAYKWNGGVWETIGQSNTIGLLSTNYFAFECHYTATRSTKFHFDDIEVTGSPFLDIIPPFVEKFEILDSFKVKMTMSELLDNQSVENSAFELKSGVEVQSLIYEEQDTSIIFMVKGLSWNEESILTISNLSDLSGNKISDTSFVVHWQKIFPGDIIITELMIDPEPSVYLPEQEYIEIYNAANYALSVSEIQLIVDEKITSLPDKVILPDTYLIIAEDYPILEGLDSTNYIFVNGLASMSNTKGKIRLSTPKGAFINGLEYSKEWHTPEKLDGGWSLELVTKEGYCSVSEVWRSAQNDKGGSPGLGNTEESIVIEDQSIYGIEVIGRRELLLISSLVFEGEEWERPSNFVLNGEFKVKSVERISARKLKILTFDDLTLKTNLQLGIIFQIENCFGELESGVLVNFQMPEVARGESVFSTEVLFDPFEGGVKFVEFYNEADHPIDCFDLLLGQKGELDNNWDFFPLTESHVVWGAKNYLVLSIKKEVVMEQYPFGEEANFISMNSFPSLPKSGARIGLFRRNHVPLDTLCYNESWHASYLNDTEGISLERRTLESNSCRKDSWGSASENIGYASPGLPNSYQGLQETGSRLSLSSDFLSQRGGEYEIIISFKLLNIDERLSVEVYNLDGVLLEVLAQNKQALGEGYLHWNGAGYSTGSYIIQASIIESSQLVQREKWLINLIR